MTVDAILDDVLAREGGVREAAARPDGSWDPVTKYGITAVTLGAWRRLGRPATRSEILLLGETEARAIYRAEFVDGPGFARIPHEPLQVTCIDFGVQSSPARAVRWLQRVCRLPVTGALDGPTVAWLHAHAGYLWLVNDALCAVRVRMLEAGVQEGWLRAEDRAGVVARALSLVETPRS